MCQCISEKNPETSGMSRATAMAKAKSIFSVLSASSGEFWVHMRVSILPVTPAFKARLLWFYPDLSGQDCLPEFHNRV